MTLPLIRIDHNDPHGWQDFFGSHLPDTITGTSSSAFHGMAGDDVFHSGLNQEHQVFFGGSGGDTYKIEHAGVMTVVDGGWSNNDTVIATGIGWNSFSSYSLTIDNRHLVVYDQVSNQQIYAIDWQSPEHKIEQVTLTDGTYPYEYVAANIFRMSNYLGDYSWEDLGYDTYLQNSTIEFYTSLYTDTEASSIETVSASWGSVINAAEVGSDGTVTVTTSGAEDGQTVTVSFER